MDMLQRELKGHSITQRDGQGNITSIEVYIFGRDEKGRAIEILIEKEEWQVVDGLNQRIN